MLTFIWPLLYTVKFQVNGGFKFSTFRARKSYDVEKVRHLIKMLDSLLIKCSIVLECERIRSIHVHPSGREYTFIGRLVLWHTIR